MSRAQIDDTTIKVPRWFGVAVVMGAFALGAAHVDARLSIAHLAKEQAVANTQRAKEQDVLNVRLEKYEDRHRELEGDLRSALGVVQLNVARICAKIGANCE